MHDVMQHYEILDTEERILIHLCPGHMLLMFAALNLDHLCAHVHLLNIAL